MPYKSANKKQKRNNPVILLVRKCTLVQKGSYIYFISIMSQLKIIRFLRIKLCLGKLNRVTFFSLV